MKALTSRDVLELWTIARADKRLDRRDRIITAAIGRAGQIETKTLITVTGLKTPQAIRERVNRLVDLGYLPKQAKR